MPNEMKPIRVVNPCGHPKDCIWFWQDISGGIHVFCVPCMAELLERMGLQIHTYRSQEEFIRHMEEK